MDFNLVMDTDLFEASLPLGKRKEEYISYLENILSLMPGHVYWLDRNNVYVGCNEEQAKTFGLRSPKEVIGKTNHDFIRDKVEAEAVNAINLQVMGSGEKHIYEEEVTLQNEERNYLSQKVPVKNQENKVIGLVGISFDITDRKKMEEAIQIARKKAEIANKAKTEFLENMRHDIRTPISGIIALAELLQYEKDNQKTEKYITELVGASRELLRFLNDILESMNVSSGNIALIKKKFDLKMVLENLIILHQPKIREKQLGLKFHFDENIPKYLIGDPVRIYRIVLELLINSIKFTKEGFVSISATLARKEERKLVLKIEVEDMGPGIPLDRQHELFIRFKRLTPSYQGIYEGSGLGLSIAKQFIDDLQGEIYCDKEYTAGAKFICLIPMQESLLEDSIGEDSSMGQTTADLLNAAHYLPEIEPIKRAAIDKKNHNRIISSKKHQILVVEDQIVSGDVVKELFLRLDCEVDIAFDGETALELIKQRHYDLIFMDLGLPDMDGSEVTKRIRLQENENPSLFRKPIIGLTAHATIEKQRACIGIGMDLVLTKPISEQIAKLALKKYGR